MTVATELPPDAQVWECRHRVTTFFAKRGAHDPDDLTSEVMVRAIKKLREGETVQNIGGYVHGIAVHVWQEYLARKLRSRELAVDGDDLANVPDKSSVEGDAADDSMVRHLRACLAQLPEDRRRLVLRYECGEGKNKHRRVAIAAELGISIEALFLRVSRLRRLLERCVRDRMVG